MDWRENKWIGIIAGVAILICLGISLSPFIQRMTENKKADKGAQEYIEKEKENLIIGPEGWSIGEKER